MLPGKQQADELDANGLIGFFKYEIKSKFLYWDQLFLWRHKFLAGCDGRVSKFPGQSHLLLSMVTHGQTIKQLDYELEISIALWRWGLRPRELSRIEIESE